ncbi:MAG: metalloprotease PmbA [Gammaproteobacteria bacterium]|nr:metalloprotease PmbA [Gammaproteobacteria bacterium]
MPDNTLPDTDELQHIVETVLNAAKAQGVDAAEAGAHVEQGLSVTSRLGEVETLEHNHDNSLGISVYINQCKGTASTSDFSKDAIVKAVAAACDIAKYTTKDEFSGLADADLMATEFPDMDLNHPWDITTEQAIAQTKECEQIARDVDKRIVNSEGASLSSHQGVSVYGNSHGFFGANIKSRHSISCTVIAESEQGMERDYWYSVSRVPGDLESLQAVGEKAAERTINRLDARKMETCTTPVIYTAETAKSLFGHFTSAISGGALYRKASFLLDAQGQKIFPSWMRIHQQPHIKQALGSATFDAEGVATYDRDLITEGVLQGYILGSYSARKLGLKTTANAGGVHNLMVENSGISFDELMSQMGTGLLVTEMMGQSINLITGDYSRGASGFWVEQGEIVYPVEEITIAGNLADMFSSIEAVATDVDMRGNIRTGSVLLGQVTVAGQ